MMVLRFVVVLATIFVSMTLHEVMHGYMAYWLGDRTAKDQGRLSLNPLRHIDPFLTILLPLGLALLGGPIFGGAKPVPFNPGRVRFGEWGVALVGIAGPLTNFLLAFIFYGLYLLTYDNSLAAFIFSTATMVNLGFFAFNILPIPPLDGSRVLYALAPEFVRRAMEWIEQYGILIVFGIVLLGGGLIGQYMNGVIALCIDCFGSFYGLF